MKLYKRQRASLKSTVKSSKGFSEKLPEISELEEDDESEIKQQPKLKKC